jgi:hypothetical protein
MCKVLCDTKLLTTQEGVKAFSRCGNDRVEQRFRGPLQHGGDLSATEWITAADGPTEKESS